MAIVVLEGRRRRKASPQRQRERLLLLGQITLEWNHLEHQIAQMISRYTLDPYGTYNIAARLRNAEAAVSLLQLVRENEHRTRMIGAVEFAVSAFNRLRENRNILVHSHSVTEYSASSVIWSRRSKSDPSNDVWTLGTLRDLRRIASDISRLRRYLDGLIHVTVWDSVKYGSTEEEQARLPLGKRPALPRRFPLPRKLEEIPLG